MEFLVAYLKKNPKALYKDVAAAAAKKNLKVFPIMYGRAQVMLGIVKAAPRGQGKVAKKKQSAKAATADGARRGPGRPRKNAAPVAASGGSALESIVAAIQSGERERVRYRAALERIQAILAGVLAG